MYEYKCIIVNHVDGDTVDVDLDLGFDVWLKDVRFRLTGIDTPEKFTDDATERIFGLMILKAARIIHSSPLPSLVRCTNFSRYTNPFQPMSFRKKSSHSLRVMPIT